MLNWYLVPEQLLCAREELSGVSQTRALGKPSVWDEFLPIKLICFHIHIMAPEIRNVSTTSFSFSEGGELFKSELQTHYCWIYRANKCPMCWRIIWLKRLNYPLITLIVYLFWGSGRMMFYWRCAKRWSFALDYVWDRSWVWSWIRGARSYDLLMPE